MYKKYFKRIFDLLLGIILSPLLLVLVITIGPIIYFHDKGSAFYIAPRLGTNGKVFNMYKFRTMKENSPDMRNEDGSTYNSEKDDRVTPIGSILRKTSIDETPQLINIIRGEMSFIGPRPDLPEHINKYSESEKRRLDVLPGVTGYNQAYYRNSISWRERIKNDVYYVDNISLALDIKIFFKTISSIFGRKNIFITQDQAGGINDELGEGNNAI